MGRYIKKSFKSCPVCHRIKINKHVKPTSFPSESTCFKTVHIDSVRQPPEHPNNDQATRYPIAVPLWSTKTAEVRQAFESHWIAVFGVPALLISNRGPQFMSANWREQCQLFAIWIVERWLRTIKTAIASVYHDSQDWLNRLPMILLVLRARPHIESGFSLYQLASFQNRTQPARRLHQQECGGARRNRVLQASPEGQGWIHLFSGCPPPTGWWRRLCCTSQEPNLSWSAKTDSNHHCQRHTIPCQIARVISYTLEGGKSSEDQVAINRLKSLYMPEDDEDFDLQSLPRSGRPARITEATSPSQPTSAYSPQEDEFPPLDFRHSRGELWARAELPSSAWTLAEV